MVSTMRIDEIIVGRRHRKDLGDLTGLKDSISRLGLLNPIGVTEDGRLIQGRRRLKACEELGYTEVEVRVAQTLHDAVALLEAERDENTERKPMTPSELVSLALELEKIERPKAHQRVVEGAARGGRGGAKKGVDTADTGSRGRTREAVARAVGMSGSNYQRARSLVVAAEDGDQRAKNLVAEMDRTGKITPAYNEWRGLDTAPTGKPKPATPAPRPVAEPGNPDLWIPRWNDNTEAGRTQRQNLVRHYADKGFSSHQIAEEISLAPETVRQIAKTAGIDIRADRLLGRTQSIDSTRVARQVVMTLDRAFVGVDLVDWSQVDPQEAASWLPMLSEAVSHIRSFTKQVKEATRDALES